MHTLHYEVIKSRLCIYVDEELWREASTKIFTHHPALPKLCSDLNELSRAVAEIEYKGAKLYAYKRLARQSLCTADLRRLLSTQLVSDESADKVIAELQTLGYLNDESWAESFIRQQRVMKKGSRSIAYKLKQKGFAAEQIENWLAQQQEGYSDLEAIKKLLATKYNKRNLQDYKEKGKVISSLVRKGFALEDVLKAILCVID